MRKFRTSVEGGDALIRRALKSRGVSCCEGYAPRNGEPPSIEMIVRCVDR